MERGQNLDWLFKLFLHWPYLRVDCTCHCSAPQNHSSWLWPQQARTSITQWQLLVILPGTSRQSLLLPCCDHGYSYDYAGRALEKKPHLRANTHIHVLMRSQVSAQLYLVRNQVCLLIGVAEAEISWWQLLKPTAICRRVGQTSQHWGKYSDKETKEARDCRTGSKLFADFVRNLDNVHWMHKFTGITCIG